MNPPVNFTGGFCDEKLFVQGRAITYFGYAEILAREMNKAQKSPAIKYKKVLQTY